MTTRLSFFLPIGKFFICLCIKTCNFLCCAPNFGRTSPLNPLSCPPRCGKLSSAISERRIHGGSSIFPLMREGAHEGLPLPQSCRTNARSRTKHPRYFVRSGAVRKIREWGLHDKRYICCSSPRRTAFQMPSKESEKQNMQSVRLEKCTGPLSHHATDGKPVHLKCPG